MIYRTPPRPTPPHPTPKSARGGRAGKGGPFLPRPRGLAAAAGEAAVSPPPAPAPAAFPFPSPGPGLRRSRGPAGLGRIGVLGGRCRGAGRGGTRELRRGAPGAAATSGCVALGWGPSQAEERNPGSGLGEGERE